jgi:predicted nucleic acid-binding protein
MNIVVTDTGPLLHLHQAGTMDLIAQLGTVHVTPTVWQEFQRHAPEFSSQGMPAWLHLHQPSSNALAQASQWLHARVLDAGEAEALAYAHEIRADLFLTDDTAARTLGESLGIQTRGSLGVVLFAAASGHLDETASTNVLSALEQHSTLWMSSKIRTTARTALARIFGH